MNFFIKQLRIAVVQINNINIVQRNLNLETLDNLGDADVPDIHR